MNAKDDVPFIVFSLCEQSSIINGYLWNRVFNALAHSQKKMVHLNIKLFKQPTNENPQNHFS